MAGGEKRSSTWGALLGYFSHVEIGEKRDVLFLLSSLGNRTLPFSDKQKQYVLPWLPPSLSKKKWSHKVTSSVLHSVDNLVPVLILGSCNHSLETLCPWLSMPGI